VPADDIAAMDCEIRQKVTVGDRDLYVAEVRCGSVTDDGAKPYVHIRKSGLSY
jgi:flavin reductase (DIM6/NTAB) family NADH-FMN oxidoreductase RutF